MLTSRIAITLAGLASLAACGGGETGGVAGAASFGAITQQAGLPFGSIATSATSRRVGYTLANGNVASRGVTEDASRSQTVFTAYKSGDDLLFYAETANGSAETYAIVDDTYANTIPAGARLDSFGGSQPPSGTAVYAGEYVGFLTRDAQTSNPNLTQSFIVGQVGITADFKKGTASGGIVSRERFRTSSGAFLGTMDQVSLGEVQISKGASVGKGETAGGGLAGNSGYVPSNPPLDGEWTIAFGGNGAPEAAGTVQIIHDYRNGTGQTPDDYVETGVFVASQ